MPLTIQNNNQREINLHQFFDGLHQLMKTTVSAKDFLQIYDSKIRPLDFKDIMSTQKLLDAEDDMMIYQELSPKYQVLKNLVLVELIWFDNQHTLRETTSPNFFSIHSSLNPLNLISGFIIHPQSFIHL